MAPLILFLSVRFFACRLSFCNFAISLSITLIVSLSALLYATSGLIFGSFSIISSALKETCLSSSLADSTSPGLVRLPSAKSPTISSTIGLKSEILSRKNLKIVLRSELEKILYHQVPILQE